MTSCKKKISALVVIHNEEKRLVSCLDTLNFADELVIVLDKCTDRSREIASKYTEHLIEGWWDLEGDRRNLGIGSCSGPWVLEVDADERIPEELAMEIREIVNTSEADRHDILVDNYVGNRLVRFGWGASFGRGAHTALFRKGAKVWGSERVHPKLTFDGVKGDLLKNRIEHHVAENISSLIHKLDSYSSAHAADLRDKGDIGSFGHNLRRIFSRFYKCYFSRKGYREGAWGFLIALFAGLYPILAYLKAKLEDQ